MKNALNLENMTKGWFIGPFLPTIFHTELFECAIKRYLSGDHEKKHMHKLATEFTVIVEGTVKMNGITYHKNSIIEINPGEATDFECLSDVTTVVVKVPAVKGDKYECE